MTSVDVLSLLVVKTSLLSVAAMAVWFVLTVTRCRSPKIHRAAWSFVLLLGIFGAGLPIAVAVQKNVTEREIPGNSVILPDSNESVAKNFPQQNHVSIGIAAATVPLPDIERPSLSTLFAIVWLL